jgi:cytochrome c
MSRIVSFVLAAGFAGVLIVVVLWGVVTEGRSLAGLHPPTPKTPQIGEIVIASRPGGDDTALRSCVVCHSVDPADAPRAAPDLYGIVGSRKAASTWYNYSKALRSAGGVWTEADLDKYLTHPPSFLPGTKKTIVGIADANARREIIEALKATSGN